MVLWGSEFHSPSIVIAEFLNFMHISSLLCSQPKQCPSSFEFYTSMLGKPDFLNSDLTKCLSKHVYKQLLKFFSIGPGNKIVDEKAVPSCQEV